MRKIRSAIAIVLVVILGASTISKSVIWLNKYLTGTW